VLIGLQLALANSRADVVLSWEDAAPSCGSSSYHVLRSTQPGTGFVDVSGPLYSASFFDYGAGLAGVTYYYSVKIY
jgi:hypothetical protein